jgi:hypothetical protein
MFRTIGSAVLVAATIAGGAGIARADLSINFGTGSTKYSIMNLGASAAAVSAAYYPEAGNTPDVTDSLNIANANGRLDVNVASVGGLAANWKGSVVLSSDQQVAAVAVTNYTGRSTTADAATSLPGTEMSAYEAALSGSTIGYFPSLVRIPGGGQDNVAASQVSRITVMNTTGSTAAYTITYIARDGTNVGNVTGNLNAYGSRTFSTAVNADLPANFVANMASKNAGFSAKVTSDKAIVALAETTSIIGTGNLSNWSGDAMASGPTAASNKLYSPAAFRLCPNTPTGQANCATPGANYNTYIQYSAFQLQNTTGNTANVTAKFINRATGLISYTLPFTIAANSGYGINLFNGGSVPAATRPAMFAALTARFSGSAVFESDQPLVGVGNVDLPASSTAYYGSYSLVGSSDASGTVYAPLFNRQCSTNTVACDASVALNEQASAMQLMNVGNATCNGVSIQILNAAGTAVVTLTQDKFSNPLNLLPGAAVGLNSINGGDFLVSQFNSIGYSFGGSLKVTGAGCSLKAIIETRNKDLGFDQYNAFNQ